MVINSFAARRVAVGLAACLLSMGAARADVVREAGLGYGLYSGSLQLPVQASPANYWSGFQTIQVKDNFSSLLSQSFAALCVDPYQYSTGTFNTYTTYIKTDLSAFGSKSADIIALYNEAYAGAQTVNRKCPNGRRHQCQPESRRSTSAGQSGFVRRAITVHFQPLHQRDLSGLSGRGPRTRARNLRNAACRSGSAGFYCTAQEAGRSVSLIHAQVGTQTGAAAPVCICG